MGAILTKEYQFTWEQDDVKRWKLEAPKILKTYYLNFAGCQWHEFNRTEEHLALLKAKICFALFGLPDEFINDNDIRNAYSDKQRETAQGILDEILQVRQISKISLLCVSNVTLSSCYIISAADRVLWNSSIKKKTHSMISRLCELFDKYILSQ